MMGPAGPDWSQEFLQGGPRPGPEMSADMAARFAGAVSLSDDRAGGDWASEFVVQRGEARFFFVTHCCASLGSLSGFGTTHVGSCKRQCCRFVTLGVRLAVCAVSAGVGGGCKLVGPGGGRRAHPRPG